MFVKNTNLTNSSTVHIVNSIGEATTACSDIPYTTHTRWSDKLVIALDAEWCPFADDKRMALIQTCHRQEDGVYVTYLFRINKIGSFPQCLVDLINDETVVKLGLNIICDIHKMQRDYDIDLSQSYKNQSIVDIGKLYNELSGRRTATWSLQALLQNTLHRTIPKSDSPRLSDWLMAELSVEQVDYAALDVYATVLIYEHLRDKFERNMHNVDMTKLT